MFILLEDSIYVGDVVEVAGHSGVVEAVTIRTIRISYTYHDFLESLKNGGYSKRWES